MHVLGQILRHALGQHGHQRAKTAFGHVTNFADQIIDLAAGGANFNRRVDQPGRTDDLLGEHAAGLLEFPPAGRGRNVQRLRSHDVPFFKAQWPVVHARRQPKAELGQGRLATKIAAIHGAELRDRHMALVNEHQRVVRQILKQCRRRLAGLAARQIAGIILNSRA